MTHMHSMEVCCGQLTSQLKELKKKWCATCVENVKLYRKIFELRKALNPGQLLQLKVLCGQPTPCIVFQAAQLGNDASHVCCDQRHHADRLLFCLHHVECNTAGASQRT